MLRALALALALALVPFASAGPATEAAEEARDAACGLPDGTGIACSVAEIAVGAAIVVDGTLEDPPEPLDLARFLICSPIGRTVCSAMSGDPGLGPFRPCTTPRTLEKNLVAGILWHAMNGGNLSYEGTVVALPTGIDPLVGQTTSDKLSGTPLAGERPCADHWRTVGSLAP